MIDLDDIALLYDESCDEATHWTQEELEQLEYEYNKTRYYALPL